MTFNTCTANIGKCLLLRHKKTNIYHLRCNKLYVGTVVIVNAQQYIEFYKNVF